MAHIDEVFNLHFWKMWLGISRNQQDQSPCLEALPECERGWI